MLQVDILPFTEYRVRYNNTQRVPFNELDAHLQSLAGKDIAYLVPTSSAHGYIHYNTEEAMKKLVGMKKTIVDISASPRKVDPVPATTPAITVTESPTVPRNDANRVEIARSPKRERPAVMETIVFELSPAVGTNATFLNQDFYTLGIKTYFITIRENIAYVEISEKESQEKAKKMNSITLKNDVVRIFQEFFVMI